MWQRLRSWFTRPVPIFDPPPSVRGMTLDERAAAANKLIGDMDAGIVEPNAEAMTRLADLIGQNDTARR